MKKLIPILFLLVSVFNFAQEKEFAEKEIDEVKLFEKDYKKVKIDFGLKQESNSRLSVITFYEIALKFKK